METIPETGKYLSKQTFTCEHSIDQLEQRPLAARQHLDEEEDDEATAGGGDQGGEDEYDAMIIMMMMMTMTATRVETTARATARPSPGLDIAAWEPPLKAKNPKTRMNAPRLTRGMECPTMPGLSIPLISGLNLPILGPSMIAPTRAKTPPPRWTTPDPAKSWNSLKTNHGTYKEYHGGKL